MPKTKSSLILHPFLFAIYAVLAPLSQNIAHVGFAAIRSLVISLLVVSLLAFALRRVVHDRFAQPCW